MRILSWVPGVRLQQRGDTIIEVLIAVTIASTILTGAFAASQYSSQNVQSSQEHSEAQRYLQAQIESTRSFITSSDTPSSTLNNMKTGKFCFNNGNLTVGTDGCEIDSRYMVTANQVSNNNRDKSYGLYKFNITWDQLGGGQATETMFYRVYAAGDVYNGQDAQARCPAFSLTASSNGSNPGSMRIAITSNDSDTYTIKRLSPNAQVLTTLNDSPNMQYIDSTPLSLTPYTYQINSTRGDNVSPDCIATAVSAYRSAAPAPAPSCLSNSAIELTPNASGKAILIKITGPAGYTYRVERLSPTYKELQNFTNNTSLNDNNLQYGTTYSYRVTPKNSAGQTPTVSCPIKSAATIGIKYIQLKLCIWYWGGPTKFEYFNNDTCEGFTEFSSMGYIIAPDSPVIPAGSKRIDYYYSTTRYTGAGGPFPDSNVVATTGPVPVAGQTDNNIPQVWRDAGYKYYKTLGYSPASGNSIVRCVDPRATGYGDNFNFYNGSCGSFVQATDDIANFFTSSSP